MDRIPEQKEVAQPTGIETREVGQNAEGDFSHHSKAHSVRGVSHYNLRLPSPTTALSWLDKIVVIAHEANRIWQLISGDPQPSPTFADAPQDQIDSTRDGILKIMSGQIVTPEDAHNSWLDFKAASGWKYGAQKNSEAKTHPCIVAYADLPVEQRAKDAIFFGIVNGLLAAHEGRA